MTLIAKMNDAKILKGITKAVSSIIDETFIVCSPEGIDIRAMDESHIVLMHLFMPKSAFDEYECLSTVKIGVNLEDLRKVMERPSADDTLSLIYKDEDEKLQVKTVGRGTRTFSLRLIDIGEDKIPPTIDLDIEYTSRIVLDTLIIDEAIKDAEIYQDTVNIGITEDNKLTFTAEGEVGDIRYEIGTESLDEIEVTEAGNGTYSLAFLKNIFNIGKIANKTILRITQNCPLQCKFEIGEKSEKIACLYYLAPRVEEEEERYE